MYLPNKQEIEFKNSQNPNSRFDLVRIEDIHEKKRINHSPYQFHIVRFYVIFIVTEGEGTHYIDLKEYTCKKGTVLLIQKNQTHKFMQDSGLKGYLLIFHDDFFLHLFNINQTIKTLQLFNDLLFPTKIHLQPNSYNSILEKIHEINEEYFKLHDTYSSQIIGVNLYLIMSYLNRENEQHSNIKISNKYLPTLLKLQKLMELQIHKTTKVQDYAGQLAISTKTLNTVTKSTLGKQTKTYLNDFLLLYIKRILLENELSIKECAFQSGFSDVSNFHKFLKKNLKLTPEEFRKKYG